jgi:peptidoglycan/xylan/chitin deacetylase (PgdA/CDA1 family)
MRPPVCRWISAFFFFVLFALILQSLPVEAAEFSVPILAYHRFAPTSSNLFTVTLREFEEQMRCLKEGGYQVIPLRSLVNYYLGKGVPLPPKSVVITIDDGHASVHSHAFPILKKYGFPVTLFIYPCCIEHASYALTWAQIKQMADSGSVEVASHTRYHPNFKIQRRRLTPQAYEELVISELTSSKKILEEKIGRPISYLSYPFGYHDEILEKRAFEVGYQAMFTIVQHPCEPSSNRGALGRYLIVPRTTLTTFRSILSPAIGVKTPHAGLRSR